jgi:hypothetical protein
VARTPGDGLVSHVNVEVVLGILRGADVGEPSISDRLWGHFTGLTLGYGYQPWRALIGLIAVILVTALLMALPVGARGLYVKDHPDQPCPRIDRIVLGVDTALPLVTTAVGTTCLPRPTRAGQVITVAGLIAQILLPPQSPSCSA